MALSRPKAESSAQPSRTQGANDASVTGTSGRPISLDALAVNPMTGLVGDIETRAQLVAQHSNDLNLSSAEQLMRNVQVSQRNLTEALNRLSSYRKAVASLLELRRREAAAIRKQSGKAGQQGTILEVGTPLPTIPALDLVKPDQAPD